MKESSKEEKDIFLIQNKLLFKKYKPLKLIGKGTFSSVYLALNIKNKTQVAIKAEKKIQKGVELLEDEAFLLYSLRGFGIPQVLTYGRTKTHNILVLPLLGKSLLDIFILKNKNININDICLIAIQILDRIEWVHSNNIVYRDIKPENFLFGKKDPEVLYLIDFGLCRKYKSSNTGKHICPKNLGKFTGTSRYASVYAMAGNEQSRRDDIESIGYMIIFLMKKKLPWQGIKGNSYKECYHKLYLMKKYIEIEELCKGLPREMIDYMKSSKSLKFEELPNYNYLKNLFHIILKKNNFNFDKNYFSWIEKKEINNNNGILEKSNSVGKNTNIRRRSSPQNRLYNKIKKSIENKKNIEIKKNVDNKKNIISIVLNYKPSPKSEKVDYISSNTEYKNSKSQKKEVKMNKPKIYLNHLTKNESNSELSNTMKVMFNRNVNSIRNESNGDFPRVNSENNIYHENIFSFNMNDEQKRQFEKNYSPQNIRFNNKLYFNQHQFSDLKTSDEENSNKYYYNNINNNIKKSELKKIHIFKNDNNNKRNINGKIIKISPIKNSLKYINNNYNNNNNHKIKINQIKVINTYSNNNIKNINNNSLTNNHNTNDNITYNTYNTYNSVNSFNDTLDKTRTNNNNINIIHNDYIDPNNQNNKRINHIIYQKNKIKINYNNNNYFNSNNNFSGYINKDSFINNNKSNKLIHLDKVDKPREVNSVNIRKKPLNENISFKKKQNIIINHFNDRPNNSSNKILNNNPKSILRIEGNINKNKNIKIAKNIPIQTINKFNNLNKINIPNIKTRPSNSYDKDINKNNIIIKHNIKKVNRFKNVNSADKNINPRKEINIINYNIKNQNNIKKFLISNNNNNIQKIENNNFIRLDKMKNNMIVLENTLSNNNTNGNNSSSKNSNEIIPNYNSYKINSLKRLPNNNRLFIKKVFPPIRYQTENDSNSVLIHKNNNNNLPSLNNNINNTNNSINISRNKLKFKYNNNFSNNDNNNYNSNYHNFSDRQLTGQNPLFIEIEPKIINNFTMKTRDIYKSNNISEVVGFNNQNIKNDNNLNNKYKTEDIEILYSDNNSNDLNKSNRINKYKMIRYKGN